MSQAQERAQQFGEAKLALSWSWFVAGTPSVVLSRWAVKSPATTQLMTSFHSTLLRRAASAKALQQSALALRRSSEYRHPFYWANIILIGDGR
jgi:CHAT domain-containing protein